jgi:hypothetical protein
MTVIAVSVEPSTPEGSLYPRYLNSSGILTLRGRGPGRCRFGINIGGDLISISMKVTYWRV